MASIRAGKNNESAKIVAAADLLEYGVLLPLS
jgi:hypothetical protein